VLSVTQKFFLLAKYGERKHLEMLNEGHIYFSPVSKYRSDTSNYRGDHNEGKVPIDPSKIVIKDHLGQNIFDHLPKPNSVKQSLVNDEGILMFCTSMITKKIMVEDNDHYIFSNEYITAIKDFGDHVLLINSGELLKLLSKARMNVTPEFAYTSGPIIYRNLSGFSNQKSYHEAYNSTGSVYDPYFVKSDQYISQNEWRLIVDGSYESLPTNDDGSYTVKIDKLEWALLIDTTTFLNTFQYKP
jgi:hypothetical protein